MAGTKTMSDWKAEEQYWRGEWKNRPYASGQNYTYDEYWRPAYQYGFEAADRYRGKKWTDVENDLRAGWDKYPDRHPQSTWEKVKDAVRDAWNRITH